MCNSSAWGGLEINLFRLATWLSDDNEVTFIVAPGTSAHRESMLSDLSIITFATRRTYGDLMAIRQMAGILRREQFDALIVGHSKDIHVLALAKMISGNAIKLVYQQQMALGVDKSDLLHTIFYKKLHAWISPLQSHANVVKQRTNIAHGKVHVVHLGLDLEQLEVRTPDKAEARKKLELPGDEFIVGIVGRPDPGKGMEQFIRAIAELRAKGVNVHGLMLGLVNDGAPGAHAKRYFALIDELGLKDVVAVRPFRKDVETAYAAMDVFVMASLSETYGMVTLEAMAAGIPVVATTTMGPSGILKDGELGIMIPPGDHHALADAVLRYKEDSDLAGQMASKAKEAVFSDYGRHIECSRIIDIIRS